MTFKHKISRLEDSLSAIGNFKNKLCFLNVPIKFHNVLAHVKVEGWKFTRYNCGKPESATEERLAAMIIQYPPLTRWEEE